MILERKHSKLVLSTTAEVLSTPKSNCCYLPSGSDEERDLGLSLDVVVSISLGLSLGIDKVLVCLSVLIGVVLGVLGGLLSCCCTVLLGLVTLGLSECEQFSISGLFLENVLWDSCGFCPKTYTFNVMLVSQ